jgi:hypothetical protein
MRKKRVKGIVELYGYYELNIHEMSDSYLDGGDVKANTLMLSRGHVQAAYKEMRELDFYGNIPEYLAWIQVRFWFWSLTKSNEPERLGAVPAGIGVLHLKHAMSIIQCPEATEYFEKRGMDKKEQRAFLVDIVCRIASEIVVTQFDKHLKESNSLGHG